MTGVAARKLVRPCPCHNGKAEQAAVSQQTSHRGALLHRAGWGVADEPLSTPRKWGALHDPPQPKKGEVHVWRADLDRNTDAFPVLERALAPEESAKAHQFRFERDRKRYVFAHGVLRTILARYVGATPSQLVFRYGPAGKPELTHGPVRFNMSHADDLALYAISRGRDVGVDVERVRPEVAEIVAEWLGSPMAWRSLAALPPQRRRRLFFRGWTRLEAYAKARGEAPTLDEETFEGFLLLGSRAVLQRWWLYDFAPRDGYVATLATYGRMPTLKYWEWTNARRA